ncbi:MAG: hypothetical protein ACRDBY_08680 [Cetobacterium sp.]
MNKIQSLINKNISYCEDKTTLSKITDKVKVLIIKEYHNRYACGCLKLEDKEEYKTYYDVDYIGLKKLFNRDLVRYSDLTTFRTGKACNKVCAFCDHLTSCNYKQEYVPVIVIYTHNKMVGVNAVCNDCKPFYDGLNYKKAKVDNLFHTRVLSHSLASGYSGEVDKYSLRDRLVGLMLNSNKWQICCSDKTQKIGAFGVYVQGNNDYVSNIDLFSRLNDLGDRVFDMESWRADGLVTSIEDYSLEEYEHTEHIVSNFKIVGVWIKEWAINMPGILKLLNSFIAKFKETTGKDIKLYVVSSRSKQEE